MSASGKIPPIHVLRGILRRLKVNAKELPMKQQKQAQPGLRAPAKYVLGRYRSERHDKAENTDTPRNQELRKLAYEYMILRRDIDERSRLQKLDTGAENQLSPKEMSRRAAARAGLELPKLNPDLPE